jgi:hypothetical protein
VYNWRKSLFKGEIMLNPTYTVTGTVTDENTVKLDEALPIRATKVRVTIELLEENSQANRYTEIMAEIRRGQKERGHRPPTPEEVAEYLRQERESWE